MPDITRDNAVDSFASMLKNFLEYAQAIASGHAEGGDFSYFLAFEYQWELERACQWLVDSPASRLSSFDKAALRQFLETMPAYKEALEVSRQTQPEVPDASMPREWPDWQDVSALPAWQDFSMRTAALLNHLGMRPWR